MGNLIRIAEWRARRGQAQAAFADEPMGAPPFALLEACPGCGSERISTMVWRTILPEAAPVPFPRFSPHYLCENGQVVYQDITDAPLLPAAWKTVLGRFRG
jgi:hypothetical protein